MPTKHTFLLSNNPQILAACEPHVTIEAEYGDVCVTGSALTMAHHGPRAGQKAPCAYRSDEVAVALSDCAEVVVGLSHIDLDTIGGVMAVLGVKSEAPAFWHLAEYVDLSGPHKINEWLNKTSEMFTAAEQSEALSCLHAFWAYSNAHRVYADRSGKATIVTTEVTEFVNAVVLILAGEPGLHANGRALAAETRALETSSLLSFEAGVVLRSSDQFVNHLYVVDGDVAEACVGYNTEHGSVTLSFADGVPVGLPSARQLVQELWGELAGGHDGIAGSPRGQRLDLSEAERLATRVRELIAATYVR